MARRPKEEAPKPHGRPTVYTRAIGERICQRLADGESLFSICQDEDMPAKSTVIRWVLKDVDGFSTVYAHAREVQLHVREDELFDIADNGSNDYMERLARNGDTYQAFDKDHVERSKLRIATRQWVLTKLRPDRFGEKIETKHSADATFVEIWKHISTKDE